MTNDIVVSPRQLFDIPGYIGIYAITKNGDIYSFPRKWIGANGSKQEHCGKWIKPFMTGRKDHEYLRVDLSNNGITKTLSVHLLVAGTFIPHLRKSYHKDINHKDGNRFNNNVENLEWCTHIGNIQHAQKMGLNKQFYGEKHGGHKLTSKQVQNILDMRSKGKTLKFLSDKFKSSISNISYICRRETRKNG